MCLPCGVFLKMSRVFITPTVFYHVSCVSHHTKVTAIVGRYKAAMYQSLFLRDKTRYAYHSGAIWGEEMLWLKCAPASVGRGASTGVQLQIFTTDNPTCKLSMEINLHERVVNERPGSRSLQHVVQVVLEPPVAHVPPAALRAVYERLPQQAEPGPLLPPQTLGAGSTCGGGGWQQTVSCVVHHPSSGLHIFQAVAFGTVPRRCPHPEPGAAFISAVVPGHGITKAGIKCAEVLSSMRVLCRELCPRRTINYTCEAVHPLRRRVGSETVGRAKHSVCRHTLTALFPLASTSSQAFTQLPPCVRASTAPVLCTVLNQSEKNNKYIILS